MTILISMIIGTLVLHILFVLIRESNELTRTKFRFRYFELRDRLAMLVANGELSEKSWEYQHIVETLNFHISAVERLSLFRIVDVLANYHLSKEEEKQVQLISKKVENRQVAEIVVGYMETTYELIQRNSRMQLAILRGMKRVFFRTKYKDLPPKANLVATTPTRALSAIRSHQSTLGATFSFA